MIRSIIKFICLFLFGVFVGLVLLLLSSAIYVRYISQTPEYIARICGTANVIYSSPSWADYDVVMYRQACGMIGEEIEEFRLKSKTPPYEQKSIFRYDNKRLDFTDKKNLPEVLWLNPNELVINMKWVTDVSYAYSKVRNINVRYKLQGFEEGSFETVPILERLGIDTGWKIWPPESNVTKVQSKSLK